MQQDEVLDRVESALKEVAPTAASAIDGDLRTKHLIENLRLDSLDVISLLFKLEETCGVKIPEADVDTENLMIVGNLAAYISRKRQAA